MSRDARWVTTARSLRRSAALVASVLVWLGAADSSAANVAARERLARGSEHFAAGRYEDALAEFSAADPAADPRLAAEILHNQAAAQFKLGKLDEARELWVRCATMKDAAFEAAARYNLGNCHYAGALEAVQAQDANAAMQQLQRAREQYIDALRLNPQLANARANLELATLLRKQIEQMSSTQPCSNPSDDPSADKGDGEKSDQKNEQSPNEKPGEQQDGEQQDAEQSQEPGTRPSESAATQPQDSDADQPQPDEPATRPADNEQGREPQPQDGAAQTQPAPGEQNSEAQVTLGKDQAERLLQKVRDMERQRRMMLLQREMRRHRPVEKDW
ncbi:MAG: hypothetical protein AB7Q17_11180 [Phycisphaerae bacterium]